jgi:hypothetical protein
MAPRPRGESWPPSRGGAPPASSVTSTSQLRPPRSVGRNGGSPAWPFAPSLSAPPVLLVLLESESAATRRLCAAGRATSRSRCHRLRARTRPTTPLLLSLSLPRSSDGSEISSTLLSPLLDDVSDTSPSSSLPCSPSRPPSDEPLPLPLPPLLPEGVGDRATGRRRRGTGARAGGGGAETTADGAGAAAGVATYPLERESPSSVPRRLIQREQHAISDLGAPTRLLTL